MSTEQIGYQVARLRDQAHALNLAGMPTVSSEVDLLIGRLVAMLTEDRPDLAVAIRQEERVPNGAAFRYWALDIAESTRSELRNRRRTR